MVQGLPVLSHTLGRKVREGLDVGSFSLVGSQGRVSGRLFLRPFLSVPLL